MGAGAVVNDEGPRVPLAQFARHLRQVLDAARQGPVTLTRNGQAVAVLVDFEAYRDMAELEEQAEDIYWSLVALRQDLAWQAAGKPMVSLEEVEARARGGN